MVTRGTTPRGTQNEEQAARWVRGMFDHIAPRYDLLNHLLSGNIDRYWRARCVRALRPAITASNGPVLDLCCGTGDLSLALAHEAPGRVFGSDFSHAMMTSAAQKAARRRIDLRLFEADALALPLAGGSVAIATAAFGFRNLVNYEQGLRELLRILEPGGKAAILEFSTPPNRLFAAVYDLYSREVLPRIGGLISGSREAYAYLPESVRRFPGAEELAEQMRQVGFSAVHFQRFTGGIAALHVGTK